MLQFSSFFNNITWNTYNLVKTSVFRIKQLIILFIKIRQKRGEFFLFFLSIFYFSFSLSLSQIRRRKRHCQFSCSALWRVYPLIVILLLKGINYIRYSSLTLQIIDIIVYLALVFLHMYYSHERSITISSDCLMDNN